MASDEQFSLCWNNFHANMSAGFHGLLSRGDLVDVTLAAEGRILQAHKLVLSVCSPYFQEMFKMNPTHHPIVFLKDVSHSALRDLLQFMYQGEVNVKQEELASFISTAEQLQVKGLTGNQNEESSTPSKPKPTSRPGPRSSQQRQSVMTKLETDLDSKPSSTPVAIKRPNRPSIASNNSSSSQSGPAKRKCVDPLEAGPSGSAKEEFVTIPDEDENNAVAPKMEPEFVNESMWDEDDDGTNNDETNFGEDDSNMEMTGFDGSTTGDGNITGGGEGGAVGDAQEFSQENLKLLTIELHKEGFEEIEILEDTPDNDNSNLLQVKVEPSDSSFEKKKRLTWVWNYYYEISDRVYICKICNLEITLNQHNCQVLNKHIKGHHSAIYTFEVRKKKSISQSKKIKPDSTLANSPSTSTIDLVDHELDRDKIIEEERMNFKNINISKRIGAVGTLNTSFDKQLSCTTDFTKLDAAFAISKRGNIVVKLGPYTFYRQRASKRRVRWFCKNAQRGCRAVLFTIDDRIVKILGKHNHCPCKNNDNENSD
ncbi:protein tramtrack, beta isoform-like isoform X4 [Vanessa cardui]|uniref:protein tramtrack, beta isoform-like isoform X4 n=1 Tax=Vanessa cardui TaxID=171605 RepID=UPI001F13E0B8|nr:protein tramtrack, beta isoform-like isoform X4 [Vanessa cardui]